MKAEVIRVFLDFKHKIEYTYVDVAKYNDDCETRVHKTLFTPMMEIKILKDDNTNSETICVFASPSIVKEYTGFEIFFQNYTYSFNNRLEYIEIEFEWINEVYPYAIIYDFFKSSNIPVKWYDYNHKDIEIPKFTDYILSKKIKLPKIKNIIKPMRYLPPTLPYSIPLKKQYK